MKLPRFPATQFPLPPGSPRRAALVRAGAALVAALVLLVLGLLDSDRAAPSHAGSGSGKAASGPLSGAAVSTLPPRLATANSTLASARPGAGASSQQVAPAVDGVHEATAAAAPAPSCPPPVSAPACNALPEPSARRDGVLLPRAAASPAGPGYLVQLGVFSAPDNALRVYQQAAAAGQPAHIQSRVVLGPFADREAAERARKRLHAAGAGPGVLIPPERSR